MNPIKWAAPVVDVKDRGLNLFRFIFDSKHDFNGQFVDFTAEFKSLDSRVKPEILVANVCPCSRPRGDLYPKQIVIESLATIETSLKYEDHLNDKDHRNFAVACARYTTALMAPTFSFLDMTFQPKEVKDSWNGVTDNDFTSPCIQNLAHNENIKCLQWETEFKCLKPREYINCETVIGCGLPKLADLCGTSEQIICKTEDDWSENGCRESGVFEERTYCKQFNQQVNKQCLTQGRVRTYLRPIFLI